MGVNAIYFPHAIMLGTGITGNDITQLSDFTPARNFRDMSERSASEAGPSFTGSEVSMPDVQFSSSQIADLLGHFSGNDPVIADWSGGNVDIEYRAAVDKGVRAATAATSHIRARMQSNAALLFQSLNAEDGRTASMRCRLAAVFDGTNDPMAVSSGVALTGTSAVQHFFTLGPVTLNGTGLNGVKSITFDTGLNLEEEHGDGEEFLTYLSVRDYNPTLRIRLRDTATFSTYGSKGTAMTALVFYLRKRQASGINVAEGTAQHIKFTGTTGTIKPISVGADGSPELLCQLHVAPGNAMWAVDTASAIT